jgi:CheY-like chemotaxis protein
MPRGLGEVSGSVAGVKRHEATTELDPDAAVRQGLRVHPDALILDVHPLCLDDAYHIADELRAGLDPRPLFVVLTAVADPAGLSRYEGIDHHLVKPVQPDLFLELLTSDPSLSGAPRRTSDRPSGFRPPSSRHFDRQDFIVVLVDATRRTKVSGQPAIPTHTGGLGSADSRIDRRHRLSGFSAFVPVLLHRHDSAG